jgi:DNA invertase Pin-like site-specific DNA recombinase
MIIGYARLSGVSDLAAIDNTRQALIEAGAETVYLDTDAMFGQPASEATRGLEAAIRSVEAGDVLLTLTPALTAGSIDDLIGIAGRLAHRGASLRVLQIAGNQALDTSTAVGAMLLSALGLLAAFNTPASLQARSPQQSYGHGHVHMTPESFAPRRSRGRPPTASTQVSEITRMREAGMRATDIADRLKICRASVYRVLNMASASPSLSVSRQAHETAQVS